MSSETGAQASSPEHLVVGHIARAHGNKGELFVMPLTDRPDDVLVPGNELLLGDTAGELEDEVIVVTIVESRPFKRGMLLKLEGVETRDDADSFAQRYLLAPLAALPPLEEGELFYHELIGLAVETAAGVHVGHVREVFETQPHHLLEVKNDAGKVHLIPYAERMVREIDRERRRLVIDPPEGLLEL